MDEQTIFTMAIEKKTPAERDAFLDQACAGNEELRGSVGLLLKAYEKAGAFLEDAPSVIAATIDQPAAEQAGAMIGPYKLIKEIGEGGMGSVFMALQKEPLRRKVALKVIKPGMDTREVIARFEAERQALALMDHPNIARVLDAGATDWGRSYFVMELVQGVSITEYCDQNRLNSGQRLNLFVTVCQAVQHAHQKGVIHRDIKPGNVMITLHDAQPVVKVIDFGIAKAIHQKLTEKTLFTNCAQMMGSPQYMSPEQAAMSGLDVDTRTDVYSLGVLLYELLTGTTPVDKHRAHEAAYDDVRRMICEEEPTKPSAKVSTLGKTAATVFEDRRTDPKRLSALIRGDLDWIVMKALEKDRTRRYETAHGFASDVRRYLNNEPVGACPPSASYRLTKFVRRNKAALSGVAAVTVALVMGMAISTWQAVRATKAERLAQVESDHSKIEASRANAVVDLLLEMLDSANPDDAKGSDYTVRELLDDFSRGLDGQLQDQPEVEGTIRATIGNAYRRLALPEHAEPHLKAALDLRRRVFGNEHEMVAKSLLDYAFNFWERDRTSPEAVALGREAVAIHRNLGARTEKMIVALRHLQLFLGRDAEGDRVAAEALSIAEHLHLDEHPDVAIILHNMAQIRTSKGDYVQAESLGRKALAMHRKLHGNEHPETAWALTALANALRFQCKTDEAETHYREAIEIFNRQFGEGYRGADAAMVGLAIVLGTKGDDAGAESMLQEALAIRREQLGPEHVRVAISLCGIASALKDKGDYSEAEPYYQEAIAILQKSPDDVHGQIELASALVECGNLLHGAGRYVDARRHYAQAIALLETLSERCAREDGDCNTVVAGTGGIR